MPLDVSIWSALVISAVIIVISLLYDWWGNIKEKNKPQLANMEETPNGN
jgi:hypothetical protein